MNQKLEILFQTFRPNSKFIKYSGGKIIYKQTNDFTDKENREVDIYRFIFNDCKGFLIHFGLEYKINLWHKEVDDLINPIYNVIKLLLESKGVSLNKREKIFNLSILYKENI
jgi:hypothetical protein